MPRNPASNLTVDQLRAKPLGVSVKDWEKTLARGEGHKDGPLDVLRIVEPTPEEYEATMLAQGYYRVDMTGRTREDNRRDFPDIAEFVDKVREVFGPGVTVDALWAKSEASAATGDQPSPPSKWSSQ